MRTNCNLVIPGHIYAPRFSVMPVDFRVCTPSWYDWYTWPRSDVMPRFKGFTITSCISVCFSSLIGIFVSRQESSQFYPRLGACVDLFELLLTKMARGTYLNTRKLCSAAFSPKLRREHVDLRSVKSAAFLGNSTSLWENVSRLC